MLSVRILILVNPRVSQTDCATSALLYVDVWSDVIVRVLILLWMMILQSRSYEPQRLQLSQTDKCVSYCIVLVYVFG